MQCGSITSEVACTVLRECEWSDGECVVKAEKKKKKKKNKAKKNKSKKMKSKKEDSDSMASPPTHIAEDMTTTGCVTRLVSASARTYARACTCTRARRG